MAIAFARITVHSRSKGHSSVAGAAYRAGVALNDDRTGVLHDYSNRSDVAYQAIMLPDSANELFANREYLWNQIEASEKRKDAQVAKDVVLALPRELEIDKQIELARNFSYNHFVKHGLAVDMALHDHGDGNPHAHLYVTTRRIKGLEIDRYKARDLNPSFANWKGGRGFISEQDYWDKLWRDFQEAYFDERGLTLHVDANHLIKQRHEGRVSDKETHYLKEENALRREASIELALFSPEAVLNEIGVNYSTFTEAQIDRILTKNTDTLEQKEQALATLKAHRDLIYLGPADDGRDRYTTRDNYLLESELGDNALALALRMPKLQAPYDLVNQMIAQYGLNSEQADALRHLADGQGIAAIVGRAGTGKSYMMRAANEMWKKQGSTVQGMAVAGVAAGGLETESGIRSHTIAYYKRLIAHEAWQLNKDSVVVMDEAGMTDLHDMSVIVRHVKQAGARLVLVGDHAQLQPVGLGAPFRAILEQVGFAEINRVMRQTNPLDCVATTELSKGNISFALDYYHKKNAIHFANTVCHAQKDLINEWLLSTKHQPLAHQLMITFKNDDVRALNHLARDALKTEGTLPDKQYDFILQDGVVSLSIGERLLFLRNNKEMGVHNGDFGTITAIRGNYLTIKLDKLDTPISFSTDNYQYFTYGYAATVHKTQGITLKRAFVYIGEGLWNRALTYVALSRHKDRVDVYTSTEQHADLNSLSRSLSRSAMKDAVLDFPLSFAIRRGFDPESAAGRFVEQVSQIGERIRNNVLFITNYQAYLQLKTRQKTLETNQQRRSDARIVAEFVDLHRALGKEWSHVTQSIKTNLFRREKLYHDENYRLLVKETHYKNELATKIAADPARYQLALELNHITLDVVNRAALAFEYEKTADQFVQAYKAGRSIILQQTAARIMQDVKAHYGALATQSGLAGISVQAVIAEARRASLRHTYYQAKRQAPTPEAKARIELAYDYATRDRQLRDRWKMVYCYDAKDTLSTDQLKQYHLLRVKVDQVAFELYKQFPGYQKEISLFGIDLEQVKQAYDRHIYRSTVEDYTLLVKNLTREQLANEILGDKHYYRYVYEYEVSWKQLSKDKKDYQYKSKLKTLLHDERRALQHVLRYQQARINTGRAWAELIADKERGQLIPKQREALCWGLGRTRNKLAYNIALSPDRFAPFLSGIKIKLADLEKHAQAHRRLLQRQRQEIKVMRRHYKTPITTLPQAAFDKEKQQWRYEAVNNALTMMGRDLYDHVLGFEGKRDGAHTIRYGQGHALVYAHSGAKAGSWHSFSSGEGGGPIQLLMSTHHGWGLSREQALIEGARLANLTPDHVIPYQRPAPQVKEKSIESEKRASKISAARYYYLSAEPLHGTIGERYLREHRHIQGDISDVRYHPHIRDTRYDKETGKTHVTYHPGIVFAARNEQGNITAVQTILLDAHTGNKIDEKRVGVVKRSRGEVKGSAVLVHQGLSNQVILAEGLETGKSLTAAAPDATIYVTLGNVKNAKSLGWLAKKHQTNSIYFAADYDPHNGHKNLVAIRDIAHYYKYELGLDTYVSQPRLVEGEKCDFNDLLQQKGASAVTSQLQKWKKVIVPERETLIDEKTIAKSIQSIPKEVEKPTEKKGKINADQLIDKAARKIMSINKEIEAIKNSSASNVIEHYQSLVTKRYQTSDPAQIQLLDKQLSQYALTVYHDKNKLRTVKVMHPKVGKLIETRAKQALTQNKDRDIDR